MNFIKNLKLNKKKSAFIMSVLLLVFVGVFVGVNDTQGAVNKTQDAGGGFLGFPSWEEIATQGILAIVGGALQIVIGVVGVINNLVVSSIISISSYNNFIHEKSIVMAWAIIRDFSNMFFILILLVIAFATILRIESYNMKKWLPKLLIMAVLINFSRTIAGLIIDFSQVFMLTFVSAIGSTGGDYMNALGVDKYFSLIKDEVGKGSVGFVNLPNTITGLLLGTLFLIIAVVVLLVVLIALVIRMVMLWIYVVLSPLAFLLAAFPGGQKYSSRWWDEFIKNVITGPILMFFVWLALISASSFNKSSLVTGGNYSGNNAADSFGISEMMNPVNFIHFIVAIGMLIGGLIITSQAGGAIGGIAAKGMGAINKGKSMAWGGTKFGADYLNRKQAKRSGIDLNVGRQVQRLKAASARGKEEDISVMRTSANRNLSHGGMRGALTGVTATGWADQYVRGFLGRKGIAMAFRGNKGKLEKLAQQRDDAQFKSEYVMTKSSKEKKLDKLKHKYGPALTSGNEIKARKIREKMDNLNKAEELGILVDTDEQVFKKSQEHREEYQKFNAEYSDLSINDSIGRLEDEQAQNAAGSKYTSTNEDELISQLNAAVAKENPAQAMAIARAIAKVGGFNALLEKNGYQATAGLTKEESKNLSESDRMKQRGMNDFMRDIFVDKLKVGEQSMLALQTDLSGIGEGVNHGYMFKQVGVDSNGKLYQSSTEERNAVIDSENSKKESEGIIRKANRLYFGAEDISDPDKKFKFSQPGLKEFVKNWKLISKEIGNQRFNKSTASSIAGSPEAMKNLREVMSSLKEELGKDNNGLDAEAFLDKFEEYAKSTTGETAELINSKIDSVLKD